MTRADETYAAKHPDVEAMPVDGDAARITRRDEALARVAELVASRERQSRR